MTAYFEAPDGHGELTIWATPTHGMRPVRAISKHDVPNGFWPDVVAHMTGTIITTNDATVEVVARALASSETWPCFTAGCGANERDEEIHQGNFRHQAKAALAALTGVPHD